MALLDTYTKPLSTLEVAHLLRRTTFGGRPSELKSLTGQTASTIVTQLLAAQADPNPPTMADGTTFHDKAWGYPGVDDTARGTIDGTARNRLKYWWIGQMINQPTSIIEKMTLFWQNHFVSTNVEVPDARFMYRYLQLMRKYALGNFRSFVIEVTKDLAMLKYLDNDLNTATKSNENYGRELQELFTIGLGNYNEDDVKAAARTLTGWKTVGYRNATTSAISVLFTVASHDKTDKQFSSFYQNTVIKGRSTDIAGDDELADLINMILAQPATARFIVRKFYRYFVQADISTQIENEVIEPLAAIFRKNYEIKPVLQALFSSTHFYDSTLLGSQIKSPLDLIVGTLRLINYQVPSPTTDMTAFDAATSYFFARAKEQQMEVLDQPSVFGWRPYYDTDFYEIWINATTLALRGKLTDTFVKGSTSLKLTFDSIALATATKTPSDPYAMVTELASPLFAFALTTDQIKYLVDTVLMTGSPYYEWTEIWNKYVASPTVAANKTAVKTRLDALYTYMFRLAEFQLA